ncbi:hypothetical protein ACWCW2_42885, partial [Streptomyces sp. NPDC001773]
MKTEVFFDSSFHIGFTEGRRPIALPAAALLGSASGAHNASLNSRSDKTCRARPPRRGAERKASAVSLAAIALGGALPTDAGPDAPVRAEGAG